jgi:hypothetical protein
MRVLEPVTRLVLVKMGKTDPPAAGRERQLCGMSVFSEGA